MSKQGNFLINQTTKLNKFFYMSNFFYWGQLALYRLSIQLLHVFFFQFFFFKIQPTFLKKTLSKFIKCNTSPLSTHINFTVLTHFYLSTYVFFVFFYRIYFFSFNFVFYFVICLMNDILVPLFFLMQHLIYFFIIYFLIVRF